MIHPGRWTPPKLGGCSLWLDAAQGVSVSSGANVNGWLDSSGLAHHATVAGTGNPQLVANAFGASSGILLDAVKGQRFLNTTAAMGWAQNGPRHIFALVKAGTGGTYPNGGWLWQDPYATSGALWVQMYLNFGGAGYGYTDNSANLTLPSQIDTNAHVIDLSGADGTGNGKNIYTIDGNVVALSGSGAKNNQQAGTGYVIGSATLNTKSLGGTIGQVFAFNRVFSAIEASDVRHFLGDIGGVSIAN